MTQASAIIGWDIGGVNTKAARLRPNSGTPSVHTVCLPYEIQRQPRDLTATLAAAARQLDSRPEDRHAVTMTAELSQTFRSKREGVDYILGALEATLPGRRLQVYSIAGRFVSANEARSLPLTVAASNWAATANWVAQSIPTCLLIDIGSTTTDLIPILDGKVVAQGRTDPERLLSGELIYTGALRTPAEAVARSVPLWGGSAGVSADGFALIGDAHLWMKRIRAADYTCATPDGRPATREYAGERLARMVCGDRDMLDEAAIDTIAATLASAQLATIVKALRRLRAEWPRITSAVVAGLGDFIAVEAARDAGLAVHHLADWAGEAGSRVAPAAAVAWLLWRHEASAV
jgi:(4-(4-[2-(gamma-L-glutamylamino)ethyl]phenoxymethyl)furan-2-yl)methanamine synthase